MLCHTITIGKEVVLTDQSSEICGWEGRVVGLNSDGFVLVNFGTPQTPFEKWYEKTQLSVVPKVPVYVLGFMFGENLQRVLLILKNRPEFQAGKWNGIGGKIESGETPHQAMVREFEEETGLTTKEESWHELCIIHDSGWKVHVFCTVGDIHLAKQTTDERLGLFNHRRIPKSTLSSTRWMIPFARDRQSETYGLEFPTYKPSIISKDLSK